MISYDEAKILLDEKGQSQVLRFWDQLDETGRESLLQQIGTIDFDAISQMSSMLAAEEAPATEGEIEPSDVIELSEIDRRIETDGIVATGEEAIATGRVGVVLVAGGQGSRLGFEGPKGAYPIAPITDATLFEIHARKVRALEARHDCEIPFYIMTSEANDAPTRAFWEANDYFGLAKDRVLFFVQGMWPALTGDGKVILDSPGHIFMGPDGHGGTLTALRDRGMFKDMDARGVDTLFYFQVDNPLVEIADPAFVGLHIQNSADISVKVCAKRDANEGLGIVAHRNGKPMIVEYTELTEEQKNERLPDGRFRFCFGSVAIHVFSLAFMKQEADAQLPLHVAHKKVPICDDAGQTVTPDSPNAYKFEKFIFDVLPDAAHALNVEFDRAVEFSPVKNATGSDSPETCRRDMMRKQASWLEQCGVAVPRDGEGNPIHKIEIDPCFALDASDLNGMIQGDLDMSADLLLVGEEESEC